MVLTIVGVALAAALWAWKSRHPDQSHSFADIKWTIPYATLFGGERDGVDGSKPLMKNDADWSEETDLVLDDHRSSSERGSLEK